MFNIWWLIFSCVDKCHRRSIAEVFCLSEVLRGFYSISRKLYVLMNTEDKGFYYLKKILCTKDVKNTQMHTLCHQDCSSSCSAALCSLQGRGWKQGCSCGCFVSQFGTWPCLWVRNTLLCWSPEIINDSGKVKGKCCDCKVSSTVLKGRKRGSVCHLPSQRLNWEGLSLAQLITCCSFFSDRNPGLVSI